MQSKSILTLIILTLFISVRAQQTISGTFSPAKDYQWLIAYRLKSGSQVYVADTAIKNGEFTLKMPKDAQKGMYRIVYAVPQEEFYFDVIFNGDEDINLNFDIENGVRFNNSKANEDFTSYFKKIETVERKLIDYYKNQSNDKKQYLKIVGELKNVQESYEKQSKESIVNHFIIANSPYIPKKVETLEEYLIHKKDTYFDSIDLKEPVLQASSYLTDKIVNYVVTALPLKQMSSTDTELELQKNIETVASHLKDVNATYSTAAYYNLWLQLSSSTYHLASDYLYNKYLKPLATTTKQNQLIEDIETYNRLRIGAVAPEITWQEDGVSKKLSTLEEKPNYLLVFWSSTCSHCLRELPKLHKQLKDNSNITVIAVGLENDDYNWKVEAPKLSNFIHVIALKKWESTYAKTYAIQETPSYFILDKHKKIIEKPEQQEDVITFLETNTP